MITLEYIIRKDLHKLFTEKFGKMTSKLVE